MNGGKLIGSMSPAAYGRMQDAMLKDGLIKRTLPPESMLYLKARLRRGHQPLRPQRRHRGRQGLQGAVT